MESVAVVFKRYTSSLFGLNYWILDGIYQNSQSAWHYVDFRMSMDDGKIEFKVEIHPIRE